MTTTSRIGLVLALLLAGCSGEPDGTGTSVDPRASSILADMHAAYDGGRLCAALALADSAERYAPGLPEINFARGLIFTRMRRYDEAHQALSAVLEVDPHHKGVSYHLGHTAFLQRRYRAALRFYEREIEIISLSEVRPDPRELSTITVQIGRTYENLGVRDSARMAYEDALAIDSTLAVAHAWASKLYEGQGRIELALHHAREALKGNPQDLAYVYRVGFLALQNGNSREAIPFLGRVAMRWPGHEGAMYNLGRALMAVGRSEEGQSYLERAADVQRLQEEAALAERGVEIYHDDPERWVTLAELMMRIGYFDKAEEALITATFLSPDDPTLVNDLANLALTRGDTTAAIQRYRAALRQDSTLADAWLNIGILYAVTGRSEAAREAWNRTLRYNPNDADARTYLAGLP